MTNHSVRDEQRLEGQTDEGAQVLQPRKRDIVMTGGLWPEDSDTTIINVQKIAESPPRIFAGVSGSPCVGENVSFTA